MLRFWKILRFLGPRVVRLLALGATTGFALFFVELTLAFGIQAFLSALGVLAVSDGTMPGWIPRQPLESVLVFVVFAGTVRGVLQGALVYMQAATYEWFRFQQQSRLLRWAIFSESVNSAKTLTLFNEDTHAAGLGIGAVQAIFVQAAVAVLIGIQLFSISWTPTLAALAVLLAMGIFVRSLNRIIQKAAEGRSKEAGRVNDRLLTSIKNLLLLQIYGTQAQEESLAQTSLRSYTKHLLVFNRVNALKFGLPQVLGIALISLTAFLGYRSQSLPANQAVPYFYLFIRFVQNFAEASRNASLCLLTRGHIRKLAKWWADEAHDGVRAIRPRLLPKPTPVSDQMPLRWVAQNLEYRYPNQALPTIRDLSLKIDSGDLAVITGPSGSGKSTLMGLLLGRIEPTKGLIQANLPMEEVVDHIGYVGPESFLIDGSVRENLVYGLRNPPSEEEIRLALGQSECQFVETLQGRLNYRLTEQGQGLSAGQKQRLCLARALLRRPLALFLDEATSNLDSETESRLLETLLRLRGKMTVIAITHRPGLAERADVQVNLPTSDDLIEGKLRDGHLPSAD